MSRLWKRALLQLLGITEQWDTIRDLLGPEREGQIRALLVQALASTGTDLLELINRLMQIGLASPAGETFRQIGRASRQVPEIERQRERDGSLDETRTAPPTGVEEAPKAQPPPVIPGPVSPELPADDAGIEDVHRAATALLESVRPSIEPGTAPAKLRPEGSVAGINVGKVIGGVIEVVQTLGQPGEQEALALEVSWLGAEQNRFTDLTIYEGVLSAAEDLARETPLPDKLPLLGGNTYTLEVAVRRERKGISAGLEAPAVRNPREDKEDLTLFILAEPQLDGIEIREFFKRVTWPYNKDSESAFFHLDVSPDCQKSQGIVEVRIYDRALDLLDIIDLTVLILPEAADQSALEVPGRSLSWPDKTQGSPRFDPHSPPRRLSIDVGLDAATQEYRLLFKFNRCDDAHPARTAGECEVEIPAVTAMSTGAIEDLLEDIRAFWTNLVITNYESKLTVALPTFRDYLKDLSELGMRAWTLLFGARCKAMEGASETIAELLKEMGLREGTLIQVTTKLRDFVFPWSILYPPPDSESEPVDPMRFWGARYKIEQVGEKGSKYVYLEDEPVTVVFALDPSFGNSKQQEKLLQAYEACAPGKLSVSKPISDEPTLLLALGSSPSAHVVYCYCHGYYPPPGPNIFRPDGIKQLKERIENLKEGTPEREALETWLRLTEKMSTESWIYIGNSQITEGRLTRPRTFFKKRQPIVFLNMCQSAELLPSRSRGLVHVFLDHGASAVVGTECPMTAVFANAFAEQVFNSLFGGDDIGTALWTARRYFLNDKLRNPLGLAYTLYGRAVHRLGAGPICKQA
jgi:hypothetical protein